jgi:hypothetical protein
MSWEGGSHTPHLTHIPSLVVDRNCVIVLDVVAFQELGGELFVIVLWLAEQIETAEKGFR